MAVASDNDFFGTIGGGIMEHKFVEMAKAKLQEETGQSIVYKQVHDKAAEKNQSGMICSGEQTIFLYKIQPPDIAPIQTLIKSLQQHKNGSLEITQNGILFSDKVPTKDFYFELKNEAEFLFIEKTGYKNILHIIGGGHCSLALSRLMSSMDFYMTVYDERKGLNTMDQNGYAHEKKIIVSYERLKDIIAGGEHVYVVIMTFGYRTDDIALRALLGKPFKYLGVLGSKKKMEKLFEEYRNEGVDTGLLKNIHSPVGIQIKSQTTDEIAVSIAAEIIAEKNKDQ